MPCVPGYDLAARNRPARQCGGDYYDVLPAPGRGTDERLLLCVADVAGKGLPAALVMSNMQATLRALLEPRRLAAGAGQPGKRAPVRLHSAGEVRDRRIRRARAGDGRRSRSWAPVTSTASSCAPTAMPSRWRRPARPLGLLPPGMPFGETAHRLDAGDLLVLFSDGVTEAQNQLDEEFGESRLIEVLRGVSRRAARRDRRRGHRGHRPVRRRCPSIRRHHHAGDPAQRVGTVPVRSSTGTSESPARETFCVTFPVTPIV